MFKINSMIRLRCFFICDLMLNAFLFCRSSKHTHGYTCFLVIVTYFRQTVNEYGRCQLNTGYVKIEGRSTDEG